MKEIILIVSAIVKYKVEISSNIRGIIK